jgi:hypothetical protein
MPQEFKSQLRIGYGSEWHLLRFLGRHRKRLDSIVLERTRADAVDWLDYPFNSGKSLLDDEWRGLDFLKHTVGISDEWSRFWPQKGNQQNWDAVAQLKFGSQIEWLLVEAKAHISELQTHCGAKENGGLPQIKSAFDETKRAFGISAKYDWLTPYYQYCNRLAVLHFLNKNQIPARLLFIYFLGDQNRPTTNSPQTEKDWMCALDTLHEHVGVKKQISFESRVHNLFLPVCLS